MSGNVSKRPYNARTNLDHIYCLAYPQKSSKQLDKI